MLVSTTLALGFAWVARNAIVRLLADIRARQLGAIMETIADLAGRGGPASAPTYRGPSGRRAGHAAQILRLGVSLRASEAAECAAANGARSGTCTTGCSPTRTHSRPRTRQANAAQLALDADQFERGPARAPLRRAGRQGCA